MQWAPRGYDTRRICPDCNGYSQETARVCPHCGRKFKMLFLGAPMKGYLLPLFFGGSALVGAFARWFSLSPSLLPFLVAPIGLTILIYSGWVYFRYAPQRRGVSIIEHIFGALLMIICIGALVTLSYIIAFAVYNAPRTGFL